MVALSAGCQAPVASDLDEGSANDIARALTQRGIDAKKEADPGSEARYRILVPESETPQAVRTLAELGLPKPTPAGVLEATKDARLVPSPATEQAQLARGLSGDLERSLSSIAGVRSARVHVHLPSPARFGDRERPPARASVLVCHLGHTSPIGEAAIKRLVAGSVDGLAPEDVAVVLVPAPAPREASGPELAHLGPIGIGRGSLKAAEIVLAGLFLALATLAGATIALALRTRRLRFERDELAHALGRPPA